MALPPPSERGVTRRHLLATAGALVFAPLAAACESLEERERAAIATATAEALRRRPPTSVPAPTQRPPEQPTVVQRPPTPVPPAPPQPTATTQRAEVRPGVDWQTVYSPIAPTSFRYPPELAALGWKVEIGDITRMVPLAREEAGLFPREGVVHASIDLFMQNHPEAPTIEGVMNLIAQSSRQAGRQVSMEDVIVVGRKGKKVTLTDEYYYQVLSHTMVGTRRLGLDLRVNITDRGSLLSINQLSSANRETVMQVREQARQAYERILPTAQLRS